jgi:hypothetical protein
VTGLKAGDWIAKVTNNLEPVIQLGPYHRAVIVAHHTRTRGAGGTSADLVPLLEYLHRFLHEHGVRTFEAIYGVNLREKARFYETDWQASVEAEAFRLAPQRNET